MKGILNSKEHLLQLLLQQRMVRLVAKVGNGMSSPWLVTFSETGQIRTGSIISGTDL